MRNERLQAQAPNAGRRFQDIPVLDALRAFAILGVVLMNSIEFAESAEETGAQQPSVFSSVTENVIVILLGGKCRTLLMLLLGIGLVLMWRSAQRRGDRAGPILARRYVSLIILFGIPHSLMFAGDFLVHYAVVALIILPFLRYLLAASRNTIFVIMLGAVLLNAVLHSSLHVTAFDLTSIPATFAAFTLGIWLARTIAPVDPDTPGNGTAQKAAATSMLRWGMLGLAVGVIAYRLVDTSASLASATRGGYSETTLPFPWSFPQDLSISLMMLAGATLFFGLLWDLYLKDGFAKRVLTAISPIGRMTLTTYIGSTLLFLLVFAGQDGVYSVTTQFGVAVLYFAAMLVAAKLWLRYFKYGPLEWVWRCATYLRVLPFRRAAGTAERRAT